MIDGGEKRCWTAGDGVYLVRGEQLVPVLAAELALAIVLCVDGPHPVLDIVGVCTRSVHMIDVVDSQLSERGPHTYACEHSSRRGHFGVMNGEGVGELTQGAGPHQAADDDPHGHDSGVSRLFGESSVCHLRHSE